MPGTASETDGEKLARLGTDGALWAREFVHVYYGAEGVGDTEGGELDGSPGGLLHVWLANAIEAGRAAGYAKGRQDAAAEADRLARELEPFASMSGTAAATHIRGWLTGWPLPANLAASELPADFAASALPAGFAGSEGARLPRATVSHLERIAESLERLAAVVAPHGHPSGAGVRVIGTGR